MTGPPETEAAAAPTTGTTADNTPAPHRPVTNRTENQNSAALRQVTPARRRRAAAWRCAPLLCGCTDPDTARHYEHARVPLSDNQIDGYADAARYILDTTGCTPILPDEILARLWARGGDDRALAEKLRNERQPQ